jgi:hypothetical protein
MLIKAADVADTVRLLLPGFVALKAYYVFGLRTKRSDAQWVLWSILASVPLGALASYVHAPDDSTHLWLGLGFAVLLGVGLGVLWTRLAQRWATLRALSSTRVWDSVVPQPLWMQFWTKDGTVVMGKPRYVARSVVTDDLDVYIIEPHLVTGATTEVMGGVDGLLLSRSEITRIAVFEAVHASAHVK